MPASRPFSGSGSDADPLRIREWQLLLHPGVQYRVWQDLHLTFTVPVGISVSNGRYADAPQLSLKYIFRRKEQPQAPSPRQ